MPGESAVDNPRLLVAGRPDLDQPGVEIHDPIDGDAGALVPASFGDSVGPGGGRREHLGDEDRDPALLPPSRPPAVDRGYDEEIGLDQLAGPKVQVGRGEQDRAQIVAQDVGIKQEQQPFHSGLVDPARRGAHQQLPVNQFVAVTVVGKRQDLFAGPRLGEIRHAHRVRSAVGVRQVGPIQRSCRRPGAWS